MDGEERRAFMCVCYDELGAIDDPVPFRCRVAVPASFLPLY